MKTIGKVLLIALIVPVLSQCKKETVPGVTITDNNFLNALIEQGIDTNGDGIISPEEAEAIISLDVRDNDIADLKGIEAFINLENLDCGTNKLTTLNVSNNPSLKELTCYFNLLETIDISNNVELVKLDCYHNQLTSLDVSKNSALTKLTCGWNLLTNLNVAKNTALTELYLTTNRLTSLNLQ